eukprot:TRINITY_DN4486_c0_g1_i2.p1 TRINITY_DN4486_c0_g1~~TRINITY_DN4486_c0_g1_i2.p1  ORF type:complete len:915 (+),score=209.93 TRINITY_DN4486_c0_g1_i2:79-2823(+)
MVKLKKFPNFFLILLIAFTWFSPSKAQCTFADSTTTTLQQNFNGAAQVCEVITISLQVDTGEPTRTVILDDGGRGRRLVLSSSSKLPTGLTLIVTGLISFSLNGLNLSSVRYSSRASGLIIKNCFFSESLVATLASGSSVDISDSGFRNNGTGNSVDLIGTSSTSDASQWNGISVKSCTFSTVFNSQRNNPSWDFTVENVQSSISFENSTFDSQVQMSGAVRLSRGSYDVNVIASNFTSTYSGQFFGSEDTSSCGRCYLRWGIYRSLFRMVDSIPLFKLSTTLDKLVVENSKFLGCNSTCQVLASTGTGTTNNLTISQTSFSGNAQLAFDGSYGTLYLNDNELLNRFDVMNSVKGGQGKISSCSALGSYGCPLQAYFSEKCGSVCKSNSTQKKFIFQYAGNRPTAQDMTTWSLEISNSASQGFIDSKWMVWNLEVELRKRQNQQIWILDLITPTVADYYDLDSGRPFTLPAGFPGLTMQKTIDSLLVPGSWSSKGLTLVDPSDFQLTGSNEESSVEYLDSSNSSSSSTLSADSGTNTVSKPAVIDNDNPTSSSNVGLIVGVVVGVLFILIVVAVVVFLLLRRRRNNEESSSELETNNQNESIRMSKLKSPPLQKKDHTTSVTFLNNIRLEAKIGSGNFGDVYRAIWNNTTTVAAKRIKTEDDETFMEEASLLMRLNHPNIVRMIGIWKSDKEEMYMILEFCKLGSLVTFLTEQDDNLPIHDLILMCQEVAAGMSYLESQKIVHRDLGARNLLVKQQEGRYVLQVSDFGLSRTTEDYYKSDSTTIPYKWCAPEMIAGKKSSTKSDVWSFGICAWEIFSGGMAPYAGMSNREVVETTMESGCTLKKPKACPEDVWEIIQKCFQMNPKERPTFQELFFDLGKISGVAIPNPNPESNQSWEAHYEDGTYVFPDMAKKI